MEDFLADWTMGVGAAVLLFLLADLIWFVLTGYHFSLE